MNYEYLESLANVGSHYLERYRQTKDESFLGGVAMILRQIEKDADAALIEQSDKEYAATHTVKYSPIEYWTERLKEYQDANEQTDTDSIFDQSDNKNYRVTEDIYSGDFSLAERAKFLLGYYDTIPTDEEKIYYLDKVLPPMGRAILSHTLAKRDALRQGSGAE